MANQSTIKKQYYQQRKRIERYYRKYEQQGYERTEKALPSIPKKITEASVRRLQSYTPEKMQKNLISPFLYDVFSRKGYKTQERTLYEEKNRTNFSNEYNRLFHTNYDKAYKTDIVRSRVVELKPSKFDYSYYKIDKYQYDDDYYDDYTGYEVARKTPFSYMADDKTEWTKADYEYASDEMALNYKDMTESELSAMDLMKTDDGYIISTNTGEIIARDMTKEIENNKEFISNLQSEGYVDTDLSWDDIVNQKDIKTTSSFSDKTLETMKSKYLDADDATINIFLSEVRKYPDKAYEYIASIISQMESMAGDSPNKKHAIAVAIEKTISEYGHISNQIAYSSQRLAEYGSALLENFDISQSALESLNEGLEEDEEYFEE